MKNQTSTLKDQDQDQVITQIKSIASQIFSDEIDDFDGLGVNIGFMGFSPNDGLKNYSYTERGMPDDRQQCQSEWISYQNFENVNNRSNNQDSCPKVQNQIKIQKGLIKQHPYPNSKNTKKQNKKQTHKQEPPAEQKQPANKIKLENLEQYGFMKQTGKLKKDIIDDIYKKKQQSEEQNIKPKKHFKTLEELYAEKEPLYDKYLKDKEKKIKAIYESRIMEEYMLDQINPIPEINKNIQIDGTFEQRLKLGPRKSEQVKSKIMSDMLEGSTFRPQTNQTKKYKQVKSVVKDSWTQKKNKSEVQNSQVSKKHIIESPKKKSKKVEVDRYASLKLNSTQELNRILELDDSFQK